jgi:hypothetical protein
MKVYLKPASDSTTDNLERAKAEMEWVIGFRGKVTDARVVGRRIIVTIEISPQWDLAEKEKDSTLRKWILAKTRKFFEVQFIK